VSGTDLDVSRGGKTCKILAVHPDFHIYRVWRANVQEMTHLNPPGVAPRTPKSHDSFDGDTDLALVEPSARFTTIPCNRRR
jgi:hypothetical protein